MLDPRGTGYGRMKGLAPDTEYYARVRHQALVEIAEEGTAMGRAKAVQRAWRHLLRMLGWSIPRRYRRVWSEWSEPVRFAANPTDSLALRDKATRESEESAPHESTDRG